ncbi:nuclear transport factor 2 family protein [Aquidulcibacter paucihalophilus]|jgi:hypothetical protein|nr:nuclear transport factor 2 family protein [Aquidulcibacter paucihalophilus]
MFTPAILAVLALVQTGPVTLPDGPALTAAIAERDAELFSVMFDRCEPGALSDIITADFEFYHDKAGRMAGREAFVGDYAASCEARKAPDAWRSRRALVADSLKVYPIPGYGAVEEGTHLFYERQGDGPERLVGRARFSIVWTLEDGRWRAGRALSIDHAPASE